MIEERNENKAMLKLCLIPIKEENLKPREIIYIIVDTLLELYIGDQY
jgi:hypothetical protein